MIERKEKQQTEAAHLICQERSKLYIYPTAPSPTLLSFCSYNPINVSLYIRRGDIVCQANALSIQANALSTQAQASIRYTADNPYWLHDQRTRGWRWCFKPCIDIQMPTATLKMRKQRCRRSRHVDESDQDSSSVDTLGST